MSPTPTSSAIEGCNSYFGIAIRHSTLRTIPKYQFYTHNLSINQSFRLDQVYLQSSKNYFLRKYHVHYGLKVENYVITFKKKKEKKLAQKVFCFCFIIMTYCIMQALEAAIYYVGLKTFYQNTNLTDFISMCTASNINYPNTGMK